jgi:hypothetical protein
MRSDNDSSMRRIALLSAAVAGVIGCLASPGASLRPPEAEAAAPYGIASPVPKPLLGLLQASNSSVSLARLDPLSLRPVSRKVVVGEYHDAWSLSPDASQLALGVSSGASILRPSRRLRGRIGIYIVDLGRMQLVQEIQTEIAAEALGWLARRRLVAGLQRGGTVVVDPLTGRILRRWPRFSFPDLSARVGGELVMLFRDLPLTTLASANPRLAVVNAQGRLRSVKLERIQLAVRSRNSTYYYTDRAGLAVDSGRARAYVFAADAPVADVDLRTMRISYHRLDPLFLRPGELQGSEARPKNAVLSRERRAVWLGDGRVVVFGRDLVTARGRREALIPAGAVLVNTATWKWRALDRNATGATFAAGRLIVFGPGREAAPGIGLRAYTLSGRRTSYLLRGKRVFDVQVANGLAYVRTPSAVYVVDISSGRFVHKIVPPRDLRDVIVGSP